MADPKPSEDADKSFCDVAPDAILLVRADGTIDYVNTPAATIFGYTNVADLVGRSVDELLPEPFRAHHVDLRHGYLERAERRFMGDAQSRLIAKRANGSEFACEIALSPVTSSDGEPLTMAIVRDATSRDLLMAMVEIRRHLLDELGVGDSLAEICAMAKRLVQAGQAFVLVTREGRYELGAVVGGDLEAYPHGKIFDSELADSILKAATTLVFDGRESAPDTEAFQLDEGLTIGTPLVTRAGVEGVMIVAAVADNDQTQITHTVEALASEAALAIQLARSRRDRRRLSVVEDRDRIARDLHDVVIQRLFAAGMRLQSAAAVGTNLKGRAIETVAELDETIAVIRETIFRLTSSEPDLLDELNTVIGGYRTPGGNAVSLDVVGDLSVVGDAIAEQLLPSLNEMVSNAVRHSEADTIDVHLTIDDELTARVSDTGIGFAPDAARGFGLGNLTARAVGLGGTATVESKPGEGTVISWCVPLAVSPRTPIQ